MSSPEQQASKFEDLLGAAQRDIFTPTPLSTVEIGGKGKIAMPPSSDQEMLKGTLPHVELFSAANRQTAAVGENASEQIKSKDQNKVKDLSGAADQCNGKDQCAVKDQSKIKDQSKVNDQTKETSGEPAKLSPLAQEMQRLAKEAEKNAANKKPGAPRVERPEPVNEQPQIAKPQIAKPVDGGRYKFDQSEFGQAAQKSEKEQKPMVLVFHAGWCGPCRQMQAESWPTANGVINGKGIKVDIDADKAQALMQQFRVESLPTTIILQPGNPPKEFKRYNGYMTKADLIQHLNQDLDQAAPH